MQTNIIMAPARAARRSRRKAAWRRRAGDITQQCAVVNGLATGEPRAHLELNSSWDKKHLMARRVRQIAHNAAQALAP